MSRPRKGDRTKKGPTRSRNAARQDNHAGYWAQRLRDQANEDSEVAIAQIIEMGDDAIRDWLKLTEQLVNRVFQEGPAADLACGWDERVVRSLALAISAFYITEEYDATRVENAVREIVSARGLAADNIARKEARAASWDLS